MLRSAIPLLLSIFALACGAGAVTPRSAASAPGGVEGDGAGAGAGQGAKEPAGLGPTPEGVPPPAQQCAEYGRPASVPCSSSAPADTLASALEQQGAARDGALSCLELDGSLAPGLVRALRAELAPRGCADALLGDGVAPPAAARAVADTWLALAVGARLYRSVRQPPLPKPPFDKPAFLEHFKQVLRPWVAQQAHAVEQLSKIGPRLSAYALGVVALEAGLADMRFVSLARAIELPQEMQQDAEIRETYLVSLEQALEPRVARGRDAALIGLGQLSQQGILKDARLDDARQLLSELYAGRRIDALDRLLLPPLPPLARDTAELRAAARLPGFYATKLLPSLDAREPKLLRARLEQAVPAWVALEPNAAAQTPELKELGVRALFELGRAYFWAEPFRRAAELASQEPKQAAGTLLGATASVLARGPKNAVEILLGGPSLRPQLRETAALDELAKRKEPLAGLAELNAAYLRGLAPPANDPTFWHEQAERYQRAQKKLEAKDARALAGELAAAAKDTEKAVRAAAASASSKMP